jgi:murein L,D-transpeptidase YcbB/YkuD
MKKILVPFLFALLALASCKNKKERKISPIDKTITAANAYNPIFLDSSAVESFLATEKLEEDIADKVRNFYYSRNFQFAWLTETGLTEQARGFWNLHSYYTNYNKGDSSLNDKDLNKAMSRLNETLEANLSSSDKKTIETELKLTEHFILYLEKNFEAGVLKYKSLESFVPKKKLGTMEWAKYILDTKEDDFEKENQPYKLLKTKLKQHYDLAQKGGWQPVPYLGKPIKKGMSAPQIGAIKQRLQTTGEIVGGNRDSILDDVLEQAIKNFQASYGYTADGKLTDSLIKLMNIPLTQRIQQLIINLNRMRWMPTETDGRLIVANIPEYKLHVYENDKEAFNMNVVVGKEGHNTVIFSGRLSEIVFSPYWNIPNSIVKKEILPAIEKNPNYLASHNMEEVGGEYRQKPGAGNSLGKVKFLFPNAFNIYFHDTPAKDLFNKDTRAYSHGCIRLAEPQKLAEYLLNGQGDWNTQKIVEAMNAGQEKSVSVKKPVPVIITYYTAWADANGLLNFRVDIYDHDAEQAKRLFTDASL